METKELRVVMLPAKERLIGSLCYACASSELEKSDRLILITSELQLDKEFLKPQHVYFVCDDKIKAGDWVINGNTWQSNHCVIKVADNEQAEAYNEIAGMMVQQASNVPEKLGGLMTKKIVASTDVSLKLIVINVEWIRDIYIPENGKIEKVIQDVWFIDLYGRDVLKLVLTDNQRARIKGAELVASPNEDNELEAAAKSAFPILWRNYKDDNSAVKKQKGFKEGWKARDKQFENDAIEFMQWTRNQKEYQYTKYNCWRKLNTQHYYDDKEMYQTWKQSK